MSNPRILATPWTPAEATRMVSQWFSNYNVIAFSLRPRYLAILERILADMEATTRLVLTPLPPLWP